MTSDQRRVGPALRRINHEGFTEESTTIPASDKAAAIHGAT